MCATTSRSSWIQDKRRQAGRKSFQYDAGFTLEPGRYHMKFLVRENITGKMGTFETRFTVPDLSADTSGLKLSTIIWSNQREPYKAAVGSGRENVAQRRVGQSADRGRRKGGPEHHQGLPPQPESVRKLRRL